MSGDPNHDLILAVRNGNVETAERLIDIYGLSYSAGWSGGYELVRQALLENRENMAKLLLNKGSRVNNESEKSAYTLLHLAARKGCTEIVAMLLDRQAIVNAVDTHGQTPLFCAVCGGSLETVKLLLDGGANVDALTNDRSSPLLCAVENDELGMVEELLRRGADVNLRGTTNSRASDGPTPLYLAAMRDKLPMAKLLVTMGADVNGSSGSVLDSQIPSGSDETPLHAAARHSQGVLKLLLAKGANVNATGRDDETPLHVAIKFRDNYKIVELLLAKGADVNATDRNGETPLHAAIKQGNKSKIARLLLKSGANVNAANRDGKTPLHKAIASGLRDKVELLLNTGADVDASTKNGATALRAAVDKADRSLVEEILRRGPDVKNEANRSSLCVAIKAFVGDKRAEIVEALLRHGFNVRAEDAGDIELFHAAVKRGYRGIVESLLRLGADANAPRNRQLTPLYIAILHRRLELVELLLSHGASMNVDTDMFFAVVKKGDPESVKTLLRLAPYVDVDACDNKGETALLRVLDRKRYLVFGREAEQSIAKQNIAEILVNRGASVNAETRDGITALHLAARQGYTDTVKLLLEKKARVNCLSNEGETPLHMAVRRNQATVVKMLLDCGANVNARTNRGSTALHVASEDDCADLVKLLIDRGADPDDRDLEKRSPLDCAVVNCRLDAVEELLCYGTDVTSKNSMAIMRLLEYARRKMQEVIDLRNTDDYYQNEGYEEFPGDDSNDYLYPWPFIVKRLELHIVAMKALELHANDWNSPDFDMDHVPDCYLRNCQREIEEMKRKMIGDSNVSFHDVLVARYGNQLAAYARNESIARALARKDLADDFLMYHGMIARRFQQGQKWRLLILGAKSLIALVGYAIPELAAIEILKYLSYNDIEKLIEACPIGDDCGD